MFQKEFESQHLRQQLVAAREAYEEEHSRISQLRGLLGAAVRAQNELSWHHAESLRDNGRLKPREIVGETPKPLRDLLPAPNADVRSENVPPNTLPITGPSVGVMEYKTELVTHEYLDDDSDDEEDDMLYNSSYIPSSPIVDHLPKLSLPAASNGAEYGYDVATRRGVQMDANPASDSDSAEVSSTETADVAHGTSEAVE